jgi:hypothetical protein
LIDTNIFIHRENYHQVPETIQKLSRTLTILKIEVLIHPESIGEIKRDPNEERKEIALSKIYTYPALESPPDMSLDIEFLRKIGLSSGTHDIVDNALLYAVYRDAVDFLISEDKEIHSKALKLNLKDRVFSSDEALSIFEKNLPRPKIRHPPALREEYVHNLDVNDSFFDSIKAEYHGFEGWFKKISREGRKCWVHFENKHIDALLIYKVEDEAINSIPQLPLKKRLKLCTFKATPIGQKIGELFIKLAVIYCVQNDINEMYLTHFPKKDDYLVDLIVRYGFFQVAAKDGEDVYLKKLIPTQEETKPLRPVEISEIFYPSFYDGVSVRKFIVPIRPEYHDRLFTDYKGRQTTLLEHAGEFIIEGNTISKAYLCHSRVRRISEGDILLFYRSKTKELTTLGVVEDSYRNVRESDKIVRIVGKRTVYSLDEINKIVEKPTLVLLFNWHFYFPIPLKLDLLKKRRILAEAPQTITKIDHKKYLQIKREGKLDERYTFN